MNINDKTTEANLSQPRSRGELQNVCCFLFHNATRALVTEEDKRASPSAAVLRHKVQGARKTRAEFGLRPFVFVALPHDCARVNHSARINLLSHKVLVEPVTQALVV